MSVDAGSTGACGNHVPFIPAWLDDAGLSRPAFRIICHLFRRRNWRTLQCNPSVVSIAKVCSIHRDTAWKALRELEVAGLLKRAKSGCRGSNNYTLVIPTTGGIFPPVDADKPAEKFRHQSAEKTGHQSAEKFRHQGSPPKVPLMKEYKQAPPSGVAGGSLFDELARQTGSNPSELSPKARKAHETALRDILEATPNLNVEELTNRIARYRQVMPNGCHLTPFALAKYWAKCGGGSSGEMERGVATGEFPEPVDWREFVADDYPDAYFNDPSSERYPSCWAGVEPYYQKIITDNIPAWRQRRALSGAHPARGQLTSAGPT